jgi:LmbE family N-acetylglucosaminyl deacetylase
MKEKILMIVAHPDDEVIFGLTDILTSDVFVVCITHGNTPVRSQEFIKCQKYFGFESLHLNYKDTRFFKNECKELYTLPLHTFNCIVSHNEQGEYGHIVHKRVHNIAKKISLLKNIPFYTFDQRHNRDYYTPEVIDTICQMYSSQDIRKLLNNLK